MERRNIKLGTFDGGMALQVRVDVRLEEREKGLELAIQGECFSARRSEPPTRSGYYSGGQNLEDVRAITKPAEGWTLEDIRELADIWDRWHLNGMNAYCEHQRALGWKICPGHYGPAGQRCSVPSEPEPATAEELERAARDLARDGVALVGAGSFPYRCEDDKLSEPCPECGYKCGTAWLYEPLPPEVLEWAQHVISTGLPL